MKRLSFGKMSCRSSKNHSASSLLLVGAYTYMTMILNGLPWKWTEIVLSFLRLHPSTEFQSLLLTMMVTPLSSKGFLPTVVDTMVIWVKFTHSSPFSLIPKMSTFTLAISCLTNSNLPWLMDLTFQVPMQYCSYSIGVYFHHQSHLELGVVFALAPSLHSFWSYFSTDLQ